MNTEAISVVIVEDNAEIGEHLAEILQESAEFTCAGVCQNARTAYRKIPPLDPDVVIMDIQLPGIDGIECTARLKQLLPDLAIMMFTVYEDPDQIFKALEVGACGYLMKSATTEELLAALHEIVRGGVPMSDEVARKVIRSFQKAPGVPGTRQLTQREEEVLQLLARGHCAKEIASQLFISSGTVSNHLKHIYRKLHVRSRLEAVVSYLQPKTRI